MGSESSGTGDPARTIALLWGTTEVPGRGPKPALTVPQVVQTAIRLADHAVDLSEVSMRKVAQALGVGTMSLYTYVASRTELIEAMLDATYAEAVADLTDLTTDDWRTGLNQIATASWRMYLRHPWMLQVFTGRPPMGPNTIAKYELELGVLEGIGLTDVEMDAVITLVHTHVEGVTRRKIEAANTERRTGLTDAQWWEAAAPALAKVFDPSKFPIAARVGQAAGESYQGAHDPEHAYHFGLQRLIDGVATLVTNRNEPDSRAAR